MNYTSPNKTASVAFRPNGIYTGLVTRVDVANQRVWVMIPRVANGFQFGPLTVLSSDLPAVNDRVGCMFVENRADDVVVLGSIKSSTSPVFATPVTCSSTTRPTDRPVGTIIYETDTTKTLIWNGSQWTGLNIDTLLVDSDTLYVDATNNRVGINTATPTVALDVDGSMAASSVYSSTSITAASAITGGSISTSGQVSGGSIYTSGQVSGASVVTGGPVTASTVAVTTTTTSERFISTQTTGTAPLTVASTTAVTNLNADLLDGQHGSFYAPTGMMAPFAGSSSPTGWLLCDGSPQLKASYPDLWALIGSTYGTATLTQFYLPDLRGRVPVGLDNMGGTDAGRLDNTTIPNTLGGSGGVQTVTLTDTQIANHSHGHTLGTNTTGSTHSHDAGNYDGVGINNAIVRDSQDANHPAYQGLHASGAANSRVKATASADSAHTHNITGSVSATTAGGGPHDNMQPYILTNYIIKT
jgi:microcystin-dependent protein